jgi:hypothetical protein
MLITVGVTNVLILGTIVPTRGTTGTSAIIIITKTMVTIKMNRVTTTMKTFMSTTGVSMKGTMIAGSMTTVVLMSAHMDMKEKENLKGIIVAGSMPGSLYGMDNLPVTD